MIHYPTHAFFILQSTWANPIKYKMELDRATKRLFINSQKKRPIQAPNFERLRNLMAIKIKRWICLHSFATMRHQSTLVGICKSWTGCQFLFAVNDTCQIWKTSLSQANKNNWYEVMHFRWQFQKITHLMNSVLQIWAFILPCFCLSLA